MPDKLQSEATVVVEPQPKMTESWKSNEPVSAADLAFVILTGDDSASLPSLPG